MKKIKFWVDDEKTFKTLLREVTQRDGKWKIEVLDDGQREVTFKGVEGETRAVLFKLAYKEPKPGTRPESDIISNNTDYIRKLIESFYRSDDC